MAACGHVSASSQSLCSILSLRLYSSFITSGPGQAYIFDIILKLFFVTFSALLCIAGTYILSVVHSLASVMDVPSKSKFSRLKKSVKFASYMYIDANPYARLIAIMAQSLVCITASFRETILLLLSRCVKT